MTTLKVRDGTTMKPDLHYLEIDITTNPAYQDLLRRVQLLEELLHITDFRRPKRTMLVEKLS